MLACINMGAAPWLSAVASFVMNLNSCCMEHRGVALVYPVTLKASVKYLRISSTRMLALGAARRTLVVVARWSNMLVDRWSKSTYGHTLPRVSIKDYCLRVSHIYHCGHSGWYVVTHTCWRRLTPIAILETWADPPDVQNFAVQSVKRETSVLSRKARAKNIIDVGIIRVTCSLRWQTFGFVEPLCPGVVRTGVLSNIYRHTHQQIISVGRLFSRS